MLIKFTSLTCYLIIVRVNLSFCDCEKDFEFSVRTNFRFEFSILIGVSKHCFSVADWNIKLRDIAIIARIMHPMEMRIPLQALLQDICNNCLQRSSFFPAFISITSEMTSFADFFFILIIWLISNSYKFFFSSWFSLNTNNLLISK